MRRLILALIAVLLFPALAGAQPRWAKLYEEGVAAFKQGNDALAEQKLRDARNDDRAPKKQGLNVLFSSVDYRPFIPDYYLGLIAARQKDYEKARTILEGVLAAKVLGDKGAEFNNAQNTLTDVRAQILAANTKPPGGQTGGGQKITENTGNTGGGTTGGGNTGGTGANAGNTGGTGGTNGGTRTGGGTDIRIAGNNDPNNTKVPGGGTVNPPPPPPPPAWIAGFNRSMEAARNSLRQERYSEALSSVSAAGALPGVDPPHRLEADTLRREIEAKRGFAADQIVRRAQGALSKKDLDGATLLVAQLETLAPGHTAIPQLHTQIDQVRAAIQATLDGAAAIASFERTGVKLFLSGQYKESAAQLEKAVSSNVTSPRIYLFLASSLAARALLAPKSEQAALVEQARRHYKQANAGGNPLAADERFISPSIRQLLAGS